MQPAFVKAYLLIDKADMRDMSASFEADKSGTACLFPMDFQAMIQVIFSRRPEQYHLPAIRSAACCGCCTRDVYQKSQDFLRVLFNENKDIAECANRQSYPAEYFWHCIFVNIYRYVQYCQDLLATHKIEQVVLVNRSKELSIGELQVDLRCFIEIVKLFFESRGVGVVLVDVSREDVVARKSFLAKAKPIIKSLFLFGRWKIVSWGRKDYSFLLINPAYNNKVNFAPACLFSQGKVPQAFFRSGLPFFHDILSICRYYRDLRKTSKNVFQRQCRPWSYVLTIENCDFDIAAMFSATVEKYRHDIAEAERRADVFWRHCPRANEIKKIIFSFSPVFMYAYYFIDKIRRNGGRVVVWQHGGLYGYADHFLRYILDYKAADVFLSYGKSHIDELPNMAGEKINNNHIVGTLAVYEQKPNQFRKGESLQGVYFLMGTLTNYYQGSMKWDGPTQFQNIKAIIDVFKTGRYGKLMIKGVKNHEMHERVAEFVEKTPQAVVQYSIGNMRQVLAGNPRFIIIDGAATTLLELVTNYKGFIFVLNCQETWQIHPTALALLKQRVFYAETVQELERQLSENLLVDSADTRSGNDLFQEQYIKRFSYEEYNQALVADPN